MTRAAVAESIVIPLDVWLVGFTGSRWFVAIPVESGAFASNLIVACEFTAAPFAELVFGLIVKIANPFPRPFGSFTGRNPVLGLAGGRFASR